MFNYISEFRLYCAKAVVEQQTTNKEHLLARDDLRAYAYEGEGSSGSSWASTISGKDMSLELSFSIKHPTCDYNL